jgi:hypothetical protein
MNKQLTELINQFEGAKREMNDIVSGISAEKFNERPAGGGWSIGECIDHLNVTDADYTAQIEKGINEAKEKKLFTEGNYKTSWFAGKFIKNVEPPVKRRLKAPVKWTPHSELSIDKVTKNFIDLKGRYIELLKKSDGVNIGKIRIPSPATNLIKFPVFVLFKINAAHQRRHLWQAKNVKNNLTIS